MARPKVPLISRRKALEAALEIVDTEGLDALSIRRLGEALNVNGASLYHHFRNKDEILAGVTRLALADAAAPPAGNENWRIWLTRGAHRIRQALISHPELIPVVLRRAPLGLGLEENEARARRLRAEGVPLPMIAPLLEGLELLAIASALQEVGQNGLLVDGDGETAVPALHAAVEARGMSSEELFGVMVSSLISVVESTVRLKEPRLAAERLSKA